MHRPSQLDKMESEFTKWIQFLSSFLNNVIKRGSYPHCKSTNFCCFFVHYTFLFEGGEYAWGDQAWYWETFSLLLNGIFLCDQTRIKWYCSWWSAWQSSLFDPYTCTCVVIFTRVFICSGIFGVRSAHGYRHLKTESARSVIHVAVNSFP